MTRRDISTINNIKLNQALTPKFLYQCKYQETPLCQCGKVGTTDHIILGCTKTKIQIDELLQEIAI